MDAGGRSAARLYLRFSTLLIGASGTLVLLGWLPTSNLGGRAGVQGMLAGCGASLVASLLGALPVTRSSGPRDSTQLITRLLAATGIRMGITVVLVLSLSLSGAFVVTPLVIWTAISYLVLLPFDTHLAFRMFRQSDT